MWLRCCSRGAGEKRPFCRLRRVTFWCRRRAFCATRRCKTWSRHFAAAMFERHSRWSRRKWRGRGGGGARNRSRYRVRQGRLLEDILACLLYDKCTGTCHTPDKQNRQTMGATASSYNYGRPIYGIGQTIIFLPCRLFYLLLFFLNRRRLDVCHTSTHGVTLVRI